MNSRYLRILLIVFQTFFRKAKRRWKRPDAKQSASNFWGNGTKFCDHKSTTCLTNPATVTIYQECILRWFYVFSTLRDPYLLITWPTNPMTSRILKSGNQVIWVTLFWMLRVLKLKKRKCLKSVIRQIFSLLSCHSLILDSLIPNFRNMNIHESNYFVKGNVDNKQKNKIQSNATCLKR